MLEQHDSINKVEKNDTVKHTKDRPTYPLVSRNKKSHVTILI